MILRHTKMELKTRKNYGFTSFLNLYFEASKIIRKSIVNYRKIKIMIKPYKSLPPLPL